ncbi:MAG: DUF3793 family protein [Lachnospiraceae bacterium]|nr:DUF3793 family protein [Lachnospiraceae bacterium]
MLKDAIIEYCAPTLAGIKTGNMFSIKNDGIDVDKEIRELNRVLVNKGLRLVPLRRKKETTLIYLYRPERLDKDLVDPCAMEILKSKGYSCGNSERCIVELVKHIESDPGFPHEIGLFLGYPPLDVKKFMADPFNGVKCVGCWKAYDNEREARKTFDRYKRCTAVYCRESKRGKPLEALIVDTHSAVRLAI